MHGYETQRAYRQLVQRAHREANDRRQHGGGGIELHWYAAASTSTTQLSVADITTDVVSVFGAAPRVIAPPIGSTRELEASDWRPKLERLRTWRGDATAGEVPALSPDALRTAYAVALIADTMARVFRLTSRLEPFPLAEGGVQLEWTHRADTVEHFAVAVPGDDTAKLELLSTTETKEGEIRTVHRELLGATVTEVLAELSRFLRRVS